MLTLLAKMQALLVCFIKQIKFTQVNTAVGQGSKKKSPGHKYKQYDHPSGDEHRTAEQFNWRRENILAFLTTLFAFGAVVFAYETFVQARRQANAADVSNELANRAWLIPYSATVLSFSADAPLNIEFAIRNIGKEPATEVEISSQEMSIAAIDPKNMRPTIEEINSCPKTPVLPRGSAMYPEIDYRNGWSDSPALMPIVRQLRINSIANNIDVLVFQGCIAYMSFGKRRETQTCWYVRPDRDKPGQFIMLRCPRWNRAT